MRAGTSRRSAPGGDGDETATGAENHGDETRPTALLIAAFLGLDSVRGIEGRPAARAALAEIRSRLVGMDDAEDVFVDTLETDQIALICPGMDLDQALRLAELVVDVVGELIDGEPPVRLMANVGVAMAEPGTGSADDMYRDADLALAEAIARGPGSIETFHPGIREATNARMRTAADLADTLRTGEHLFLQYQPVVDLSTDTIVGTEALVRWAHPERGTVPPCDFIPVAEQTGLIADLGRWVLGRATRQLAEWQPLVEPGFRMHVNLSPIEMRQPRLADVVSDVLDRSGVCPGQLLLEITETSVMTGDDAPISRLEELRKLGVSIGIDDFGTGYSSISYLRELPVDMVKLDRSLTSLVASSPDEYALTRAVFGLMRSSGLEIVAEGIEEHVQVAHLRAMRCRYGQGFLLARPDHPEKVTDLLQSGPRS